jgi:hypothetical protein
LVDEVCLHYLNQQLKIKDHFLAMRKYTHTMLHWCCTVFTLLLAVPLPRYAEVPPDDCYAMHTLCSRFT